MAPVCSEHVETWITANCDGGVWAEPACWGQSGAVCMCRFHFSEASPDRLLYRGPSAGGWLHRTLRASPQLRDCHAPGSRVQTLGVPLAREG